jgi:hypothetical protein
MKLDTDPFPIGMVVSNELCNRMIKPHNPEISVWKENMLWKLAKGVKPTLAMFIEKYQRQLEEDRRYQVTRGIKWDRFFEARNRPDQQRPWRTGEPQRRTVYDSTDQESGIRQNPQFTDRSGLSNPDRRVNHPDVLHNGEESSRRTKQTEEHVMMVGSRPCRVSSKIHING